MEKNVEIMKPARVCGRKTQTTLNFRLHQEFGDSSSVCPTAGADNLQSPTKHCNRVSKFDPPRVP